MPSADETTHVVPHGPAPREHLDLVHCQWMLACWWLGIGFGLIVLLIIQTMSNMYAGQHEQAWSWLVPMLVPTFSVIVGGIVHTASSPSSTFTVSREIYQLAKGLSIAYLGLVAITLGAVNYVAMNSPGDGATLRWLSTSRLWLAPLNAPVGIVLGVFFASSQDRGSGEGRRTSAPRAHREPAETSPTTKD